MYGPTDLKKNTLITLDGQPYKVVEYSQKVMGRGGSIVNVKVNVKVKVKVVVKVKVNVNVKVVVKVKVNVKKSWPSKKLSEFFASVQKIFSTFAPTKQQPNIKPYL